MPHAQNIPYGFCHCGCGEPANVATRSCKIRQKSGEIVHYKIGDFYRYKSGHANKIRPEFDDAVPFKIDGINCRLLKLTQGQYTIMDESDYAKQNIHKWSARWNKWTKSFYVVRSITTPEGRKTLLLHREILAVDCPHVDHANRLSLDNRRKNLRPATRAENKWNQGPNVLNKSGYKGVHLRPPPTKPWVAKINRRLIGYFRTAEEAAHAYDAEAVKRHGEFAWLNFPDESR